MNDILDAVSTRIKAPYFGYALLAFVAMNWRGIFLLIVTEGSPQERLVAFDAETNFSTLFFYPLLVGAIAAATSPWLRLVFGFFARKPLELIDNLHLESEHKNTIKKTQLEHSRSEYFATREVELIRRAKSDEAVQEIESDQLKKRLTLEFEELRRERDSMSQNIGGQKNRTTLSAEETEILKIAAQSGDGIISRDQYLGGRHISIGGVQLGGDNHREYLKYEFALKSLLSKDLVQTIGREGGRFELSHRGWEVADTLILEL